MNNFDLDCKNPLILSKIKNMTKEWHDKIFNILQKYIIFNMKHKNQNHIYVYIQKFFTNLKYDKIVTWQNVT